MNALAKLPDISALKVLEPEHLRAAATVAELADKLPTKITGAPDVLAVQEVMRRSGALYDVVENVRKTLKTPLDALIKHVQAQAKRVLDPMASIEAQCKTLLSDYVLQQEREKQARERAEMAAAKVEARETPNLVNRAPAPAAAFTPKIHTRVTYEAVVTDSTLLPDEYWIPNQKLIDERALGGNPIAIPGVTIRKVLGVNNR